MGSIPLRTCSGMEARERGNTFRDPVDSRNADCSCPANVSGVYGTGRSIKIDVLIAVGRPLDMKPQGVVTLIPTVETNLDEMRKALVAITHLWPDPGMCAEIAPEYVGPNDGRMRADLLW